MTLRILRCCALVLVSGAAFGALPGEDAYLEAREFERVGRYADALAAHRRCAEAGGPLTPYALLGIARCGSRGGSRAAAIDDYQSLLEAYPEGPWVGMALAQKAETLRLEKRFGEAAEAYLSLLARPLPPAWLERYRWLAVQCLIENPETKPEAFALCRALCAETRSNRTRLDAAKVLAESRDPEDRFEAAYAMVRSGAFQDASRLLPSEGSDEASEAGWAYLRARVVLGTNDATQGRARLERIAAEWPDTEWARWSLSHLARSLFLGGRREEANAVLERLLEAYPGSEEAAEALWRFAEASESRVDEACAYYLRFATLFPEDSRADNGLLKAGHLYSDHGKNAEAIAAYGRLLDEHPRSRFLADAAYLRGELRERGRDNEGAAKDYARATQGDLGNFYVHRALERLYEMGHDNPMRPGRALRILGADSFVRPFAWETPPVAEPNPDSPVLARLGLFGSHGLEEREWEAVGLAMLGPDLPDAVYEAVSAAGMPSTALWLLRRRTRAEERDIYAARWRRVMFPRAYWAEVQAISAETGLDPLFVLAVARQESFFRSDAVSTAGATGVMQLMPATAEWLGSVERAVNREHVSHLMHPANSLRLGAYYLVRMLERSNDNKIYALASYNAGPGNVSRWRTRYPNMPSAEFLEAIPFRETRHFVKRVLGNYGAYHSLYLGADALDRAELAAETG